VKADLCDHEVPGEDEAQEVHEAGGGSQQFRVPGGDLVDEGVQQLRAAGHQTHRVNQHLHAGQFQAISCNSRQIPAISDVIKDSRSSSTPGQSASACRTKLQSRAGSDADSES